MGRRIDNLQIRRRTLFAAAAVVLVATGATLAFILAEADSLENVFPTGSVSCEVNESFNGSVKSDVTVKNTGTADAYIRAAIVVTWQDESGRVFADAPEKDADYTMTLGTGWTVSDGYYYWPDKVFPEGSTGDLIVEAREVSGRAPEGYHLCIEILGSAVQADGVDTLGGTPRHDAWNQ